MTKKMTAPLFFGLLILISAFSANAQSAKAKTMMEEIKKEYPYRQTQVAEKCDNVQIPFEVDFASFGDNTDALLRVPQLGLKETANGFRRYCTDSNNTSNFDKAKVSALKSKVKKIMLKHVATDENKKISLQKDGTVLIEMKFDNPLKGGIDYIAIAKRLAEIL